jgi:phosphohistidine phosphatase
MKRLYIIRHAKSDRDIPELPDFERPLNMRGRLDAALIGDMLKTRGITPDLMVSSPANRALSTARLLSEYLQYPLKNIKVEEHIYEAWQEDLVEVLHGIDDRFQSVVLIGHNPGLQLLASYLSDFTADNIPTCGVVALELAIDHWAEADAGQGKILFFEYPKKLRNS